MPVVMALVWVSVLSLSLQAAPEWMTRPPTDLVKGDPPFEDTSFNVGPTGFRGWVFHRGVDSSESRQILVKSVDTNSPADGILKVGDVIVGANGAGGNPVPFASDARRAIAEAIMQAEARAPATLALLRWRPIDGAQGGSGATEPVTLTLETMGAYSPTAPYNCAKSRKILLKGAKAFYEADDPGTWNLGVLFLLAADDPSNPDNDLYQAKAREWARELIVPASELDPKAVKVAWSHSYKLIILAEYYLKTRDAEVFPTLEARALCYARNQNWYGTTGHQYGVNLADGSNGPMAGYGAINGTGVAGFLGLVLAREAGVESPELDAAISRSDIFFASYANKSGIPYGEHSYSDGKGMYDMNGKNATVALALMMVPDRLKEAMFFAKLTTASSEDRQSSHAGPFFNYVWPTLGAAAVGEAAAAHYFKRTQWLFDLERKWDGSVVFDHFGNGDIYRGFPAALSHLLTYTLPLRQLYITGRGQDKSRWLSTSELADVVAAEDFDVEASSTKQLASALSSWAPQVRQAAAVKLAERIKSQESNKTLLSGLHAVVLNPGKPSTLRNAICQVLRYVADPSSASVLADLLNAPDSYVRFGAANALRYLPREAVMPHIDKILNAAASTIQPAFPPMEGDPLQFAQAEMCQLLFYGGTAYGPPGLLSRDINSVDRDLLWPAVRAIAATPTGHARGAAGSAYKQLTKEEVFELAESIVESVRVVAPADAMFAGGVRKQGAEVLQKYDIAEGVPLCRSTVDRMAKDVLTILERYGHSALTVDPDPDIMQLVYELWAVNGIGDLSGMVDTMLNGTNTTVLTPLKRIDSVKAGIFVLALPDKSTTLHVEAANYGRRKEQDNIYTWRKVYGAGAVSFSPNGSWNSKNTTVNFVDEKPGKYRFEVTMSDVLGYTVVRQTVDVTLLAKKKLFAKKAELPPNEPPVAESVTVRATPGVPLPVFLKGTDPDADDLAFIVSTSPLHGKLTGTAPNLTYTADFGYEGRDGFAFDVIDGQAVGRRAQVDIRVAAIPVGVTVYEGFDYENGSHLLGQDSTASAVGLAGSWTNKTSNNTSKPSYGIFAESLAYPSLPSTGGRTKLHGGGHKPIAYCTLDRAAFLRDGLLADGKEMWFSVVVGLGEKLNRTNGSLGFGLKASDEELVANVGFKVVRASLNACINDEVADGRMANQFVTEITMPAEKPHMVLGHCVWGASDRVPDVVEIYRVLDIAGQGPVLLKQPVSVLSAVVDQKRLDTLYFEYWGEFYLDEIRVGPTYESVLLGTVALSE